MLSALVTPDGAVGAAGPGPAGAAGAVPSDAHAAAIKASPAAITFAGEIRFSIVMSFQINFAGDADSAAPGQIVMTTFPFARRSDNSLIASAAFSNGYLLEMCGRILPSL
jgi:hypothetical protein